jgi:hypothetical protein
MKTFLILINILGLLALHTYDKLERQRERQEFIKIIKAYDASIKTFHGDRNYFSNKWYDVIEPNLSILKQGVAACN